MIEGEVWKYIDCFDVKPNTYRISNKGIIINNDGKIMKQRIHCKDVYVQYMVVALITVNGNSKPYLVHRLVAAMFIAMCRVGEIQVNHKDVNSFNNCSNNLEWCTPLYNTHYAMEYGNAKFAEDVYNALFTNDQVHIICNLLKQNVPYDQILQTIGIENTDNNRDSIGCIKRGITYKSISKEYNLNDIEDRISPRYTNEQIHQFCKCIQEGKRGLEVAKEFGIQLPDAKSKKAFGEFIRRIRARELFVQISQYYNW